MTTLDFAAWEEQKDKDFMEQLRHACEQDGFFFLKNHGIPYSTCEAILEQAAQLFDLNEKAKDDMHIRHFNNFRGYSVMKNERDWREQYHLGWEWKDFNYEDTMPTHYRLAGQNPYPPDLGNSFLETSQNYSACANRLGEKLLEAVANSLGLNPSQFLGQTEEPNYFLMKLICYHPIPDGQPRYGVAPHCDWSWLTILLQDDIGGLEVQSNNGDWVPVEPQDNALFVNLGELMEIFTNGRYCAAPHRVISPLGGKRRISVPAFINPPLNAWLSPFPGQVIASQAHKPNEHIHRVAEKGATVKPFLFGESEWRRKGQGKWCYNEACL